MCHLIMQCFPKRPSKCVQMVDGDQLCSLVPSQFPRRLIHLDSKKTERNSLNGVNEMEFELFWMLFRLSRRTFR
jgi:hypothetical protein